MARYTRKTDDELLDARYARREKATDRYLTRLEKKEARARRHIGELCRDGQTVYYISLPTVKYREATSEQVLIDFLVRNHYVR